MARRHLDAETLSRLVLRDLDRQELEAAAWHLYKCRRCRARVRQASPEGDRLLERLFEGLTPTDVYVAKDYSGVFARVARSVAGRLDGRRREEAAAEALVKRLLARPREERRAFLDGHLERYPEAPSWSLALRLLAACRGTWSDHPAEAEELGEMALEVCVRKAGGESGEGGYAAAVGGGAVGDGAVGKEPARDAAVHGQLGADVEARAWAYVGNCRRIRADLHAASQAFQRARELLARGTGDAAERARVLDLEASLLRARRRFAASEKALEEAVRLYCSIGDTLGEARSLVKLAITLGVAQRVERAIEVGRRALDLLDESAEPRLYLAATFNLLLDLYDLEGADSLEGELEGQLAEARRLTALYGTESEGRRLRWFLGMVARDRGQWEEAERLLREVRREYVEADMPYEAASASMDLAVLCLEQGKTAETRQLAMEMLSIYESREVQREALAALMLFQQTVLADDLTAATARKMSTAMRRGRLSRGVSNERPS